MRQMKLKRPLPDNRSYEQVLNHYLVEKAIAQRIKGSDREGRKRIYRTMYDQLFKQVPDHPRLTSREDMQSSFRNNQSKLSIIKSLTDKSTVFVEFAPGDCKFASEVARHARQVYGIDISDQRSLNETVPENFKLIIYDGYILDLMNDNSVDIVFSDQFIEHLHPDETRDHFKLAYKILKDGGRYIFRTPHAFSGPHDVSQYFCYEPEGFHLKEWTYTELIKMLNEIGYSQIFSYWSARGIKIKMVNRYFETCEKALAFLPKRHIRFCSKVAIPTILIAAIK